MSHWEVVAWTLGGSAGLGIAALQVADIATKIRMGGGYRMGQVFRCGFLVGLSLCWIGFGLSR